MKNWLFKILILVVGVFYMIAFLEINIGDYQQTWHDQYDSYILSAKCDHAQWVKFSDPKAFEPPGPVHFSWYLNVPVHVISRSFIAKTFVALRLYLRHAVFLI